ncbi:DUF155-domain-containing protein, partial [Neoconidiobolus thromboides FSU 785]
MFHLLKRSIKHKTYLLSSLTYIRLQPLSSYQPFLEKSNLIRDIGKEASEALSVSSTRVKEQSKLQKKNNLRRVKINTQQDEENFIFNKVEQNNTLFLNNYKKSHCQAYCTAEEYDLTKLLPLLSSTFKTNKITDDVYHLTSLTSEFEAEIFLFQGGTFVIWGLDKEYGDLFLENYIRKEDSIELGRYLEYEKEDFSYYEDGELNTQMFNESILIDSKKDPILTKLAFSHGLARSAKLSILEDMLDNLLQSMSHYPLILVKNENIRLKRKDILNKIGQVFLIRGILNLQSESFLDTPDYYWSKPKLEVYYDQISKNLDVRPRIAILNKKLDYANELTDLLREQLSENHSNKLEWCIILLIAVEVGFELIRYYERYKQRNNTNNNVNLLK